MILQSIHKVSRDNDFMLHPASDPCVDGLLFRDRVVDLVVGAILPVSDHVGQKNDFDQIERMILPTESGIVSSIFVTLASGCTIES